MKFLRWLVLIIAVVLLTLALSMTFLVSKADSLPEGLVVSEMEILSPDDFDFSSMRGTVRKSIDPDHRYIPILYNQTKGTTAVQGLGKRAWPHDALAIYDLSTSRTLLNLKVTGGGFHTPLYDHENDRIYIFHFGYVNNVRQRLRSRWGLLSFLLEPGCETRVYRLDLDSGNFSRAVTYDFFFMPWDIHEDGESLSASVYADISGTLGVQDYPDALFFQEMSQLAILNVAKEKVNEHHLLGLSFHFSTDNLLFAARNGNSLIYDFKKGRIERILDHKGGLTPEFQPDPLNTVVESARRLYLKGLDTSTGRRREMIVELDLRTLESDAMEIPQFERTLPAPLDLPNLYFLPMNDLVLMPNSLPSKKTETLVYRLKTGELLERLEGRYLYSGGEYLLHLTPDINEVIHLGEFLDIIEHKEKEGLSD